MPVQCAHLCFFLCSWKVGRRVVFRFFNTDLIGHCHGNRNRFGSETWMLDEQRPTLSLTAPRAGANPPLSRIVVGMHDYGGLDTNSFQVVASFGIDGIAAGQNLAGKFQTVSPGVWELKLGSAITVPAGKLTVSVKDRQGNVSRIERTFSVK